MSVSAWIQRVEKQMTDYQERGLLTHRELGQFFLDFSEALGTNGKKETDNMLVLSRRKDESIMIGDDIKITIIDVRGDKVRLGINAPRRVSVHRIEIYDAIQREKDQMATEDARAGEDT